jgi:glycosyltransferase involved in cell wall biosynthesis
MIVKDEEADIQRCLDSVAPYIDYWVISDTGSSDNTMQKIQEIMDGHGVPGELHEHKWEDFSTNRNHVIKLARSKADYLWFMDADDDFVSYVKDPFAALDDETDMWLIRYELEDGTKFSRQCLFHSKKPIVYHCVFHEFLAFEDVSTIGTETRGMIGECMIYARSSPLKRASDKKTKYRSDARIIKKAMKDPSTPKAFIPRYQYYLAMSYQEAGDFEKSIVEYKKRLLFNEMKNDGEIYLSLKAIADIKKHLHKTRRKYKDFDIIDSYLAVWERFPTRIEPIVQLMDFLFHKRRFLLALMVAELPAKVAVADEDDVLHTAADYTYNFPAQYAACAVEAGFKDFAIKTAESALKRLEGKEEKYMNELLSAIKEL